MAQDDLTWEISVKSFLSEGGKRMSQSDKRKI